MFVRTKYQIRERDTEESSDVHIAEVVRVMGLMGIRTACATPPPNIRLFQSWFPPGLVWLVMRDVDRFVQEMGDGNGSVPANENRHSWK